VNERLHDDQTGKHDGLRCHVAHLPGSRGHGYVCEFDPHKGLCLNPV